jgi:hypothetical protein
MEIKRINGDIIDINLCNIKSIFDLKCKLAEMDNLQFFDVKILNNGIEIDNKCSIHKFDKLFYIPIDSKLGYKVKHISI